MKTVFEYMDPNVFLKDRWEALKLEKPQLSLRSLSHYFNVSSHTSIHQMILGKRKISQQYVVKFSEYFSLTEKEAEYFDCLVKFSKEMEGAAKNHFFDKLQSLRPKKIESIMIMKNFEIQKNPIHGYIMELTELMDTPNNYGFIQKKLKVNYNSFDIKKAVELLTEEKFLATDEKGFLRKVHKNLYSTQDVRNQALVEYHKTLCEHASKAIESQGIKDREYNAYTFNIEKEKLGSIKQDIRNFISELSIRYEKNINEANATYQFSSQFFQIAGDDQ